MASSTIGEPLSMQVLRLVAAASTDTLTILKSNMRAKQKAEDLFDKIYNISGLTKESKEIALIAVDLVLGLGVVENERSTFLVHEFYTKVKQEIEKL
ncbi:MAG: hypothetical protein RIT01_595 [Pseudomonadota bacterium]|jgi:hypothetical protein